MTQPRIVRVEMEFEDGTIRRLRGAPAEAWLEDLNSVVVATHIRYGKGPLQDYPWENSHKDLEAYDNIDD